MDGVDAGVSERLVGERGNWRDRICFPPSFDAPTPPLGPGSIVAATSSIKEQRC